MDRLFHREIGVVAKQLQIEPVSMYTLLWLRRYLSHGRTVDGRREHDGPVAMFFRL